MKASLKTVIGILLLSALLGACEYNFIEPDRGDPVDPEDPISFSAEIEPIWSSQSCTNCHNGSTAFSLQSGEAYQSLISENLLDMENADQSKIVTVPGTSGRHANYVYVGNQRQLIIVWIEQGAENN